MARRRGGGSYTNRGDGVPAQKYTGLDYGENKAVNNQMDAMPARPQGGGGQPAPARGRDPGPARGPNGVFGPTERPDEPLTAGVDAGPGPGGPTMPQFEDDVNHVVRAIAVENPHLAEYLLGLADA